MNNDEILWQAAVSNLQLGKIAVIAEQHTEVTAEIRQCDPIKAATVFSTLLCRPELQASCIRLEALIHLSCAYAEGSKTPTKKQITTWFAVLGKGPYGMLEDPAEDVFLTLASNPRGNFKFLQGIWESAGFYLQRILNAMEWLEPSNIRKDILRPVEALLLLSNEVCQRAKLERYMLGEAEPQKTIPKKIADTASANRSLVMFDLNDLARLGISLESLTPFVFSFDHREALIDESIGHSMVERTPLSIKDDTIYFLLPTAVAPAIQRFLFKYFNQFGKRDLLLRLMETEYNNFLPSLPLLGGNLAEPFQFKRTEHGRIASLMNKLDVGRYLHFVFILDDLEGFDIGGLVLPNPAPDCMLPDIENNIDAAYEQATADPEFVGITTLFCVCGIGRLIHYAASDMERFNWRLQSLSPANLTTLSFTIDFNPLVLLRLLDAEETLASVGMQLINVNGLLNLVAWSRRLKGHLVPHADIPEDFHSERMMLQIAQNSLRELRHEVVVKGDEHRTLNTHGELVPVRKRGNSFFAEYMSRPLYVEFKFHAGGDPPLVYEAKKRNWWAELSTPELVSAYYRYQRWLLIETCLGRIAPILDQELSRIPNNPILWRCIFEGNIGDSKEPTEKSSYKAALASITTTVDEDSLTVTLHVGDEFERAIFHPENIAEKALVYRTIEGFYTLSGDDSNPDQVKELIEKIVPCTAARETHAFQLRDFRDYVRGSVPPEPITTHFIDAATLKIGLGWKTRDQADGSRIESLRECTAYLNQLVQLLTNEIRNDLRQFSRHALIDLCLNNYESASNDRGYWRLTVGAVEALLNDKEAARQVIVEHERQLNSAIESCRTLAEMALVECPLEKGRKPGILDLSRLMTRVLQIMHFGWCSNAIRWGAMEPVVRIFPLGDVLMNFDFHEEVWNPFGRTVTDMKFQRAIERYAEHYAKPKEPGDGPQIEPEFLEALRAEWCVSLDDVMTMLEFLEKKGMVENSAIITCQTSVLHDVKTDRGELNPETVRQFLEMFSSKPRKQWDEVDPPYDEKDIHIWRFKRRLSLLRKPLMQLDDSSDPLITFAPGMVRDGLVYQIEQFYSGKLSHERLFSAEMKSWKAVVDGNRGKALELEVKQRLEELGWKTRHSVKVTELLKRSKQSLGRDYGEVDVLAWHENAGRVIVVECKDVLFRMTPGEVAEQLTDFMGEVKPNGKRDELRKHLDRLDILRGETEALKKFCKLDASPGIEGLLVFRNPVPMQWAWERLKKKTAISTLNTIESAVRY